MDGIPPLLAWLIAGWLLAGLFLGVLGGFAFVRRVDGGEQPKSWLYRMTLLVLYPVILLRAALWAMWEVMIGGAR
jgi:hypothetical protein